MTQQTFAAIGSCLLAAAMLLGGAQRDRAVADTAAQPSQQAIDPSIGKVEVTLDLPKDKPYVGEMILLRMRSFIRADIVRDQVVQPPLLNFSWQQLGRDKPIQAMVDGFSVSGIERDLAIFPDTSGRLIIEPFSRHVTIITSDNRRVETDFMSKPVYVDVQNYTAINPPDQWWLPAKSVTISDAWSEVPDEIKPGTLSTRTITVEAVGLTGDRLPPPPDIRAPGTIAFRGPTKRETILTEDGPVARGTYQWSLRPTTSAPAQMPAITIPWFDTEGRRMRHEALPPVWLAYVGTLVHPSHEKPKTIGLLSPGPIAAGVAGFAWMAALLGFVVTSRQPLGLRAHRTGRALKTVRRRARFNDLEGFGSALVELGRSDPARWAIVAAQPHLSTRLAAIDVARYGRNGDRSNLPALRPLAADICREWIGQAPCTDPGTALPPLDGRAGLTTGSTPLSFARRWWMSTR